MFAFFDNYFKTGSRQLHSWCRPHVGTAMKRVNAISQRSRLGQSQKVPDVKSAA